MYDLQARAAKVSEGEKAVKKAIEILQKVQIAVGGVFLLIFLVTVVFQMFSR